MPVFDGNVKKILTPISKKLTIAIATTSDTAVVYNNKGTSGCVTAERLFADLKAIELKKGKVLGIKGIDIFDPNKNGVTPQIMVKERKNADGTTSKAVYLMLSDGIRASKPQAKAIDIEL